MFTSAVLRRYVRNMFNFIILKIDSKLKKLLTWGLVLPVANLHIKRTISVGIEVVESIIK